MTFLKFIRCVANVELSDLYSSPYIVRMNKSRKIRWAWHVARTGIGEVYIGLWWGNLRERDHLEDSGLDGRIILRWSSGCGMGDVACIDLAQDRDRWLARVNAVMNLPVPKTAWNFLTAENQLASEDGLCSME